MEAVNNRMTTRSSRRGSEDVRFIRFRLPTILQFKFQPSEHRSHWLNVQCTEVQLRINIMPLILYTFTGKNALGQKRIIREICAYENGNGVAHL